MGRGSVDGGLEWEVGSVDGGLEWDVGSVDGRLEWDVEDTGLYTLSRGQSVL